jgi:hypothetical protein
MHLFWPPLLWTAVAERSGDTAFEFRGESKNVMDIPLRSVAAVRPNLTNL